MRSIFFVSIVSLISAVAVAAPAPPESWGKAGVTLDQYRQDALECGLKGYYTDISNGDDAKEFARASRQLDNLNSTYAPGTATSGPGASNGVYEMAQYAASEQHIVDSVRPDMRYKSIKHSLEATTADCLQQRGYSKFTLTDEQRHRLSKLKAGSDERRAYLYSLASDASVLTSQRALVTH
jgi:hypothetical protein